MPLRPLREVAADLGLTPEDLHPHGRDVAKVDLAALEEPPRHDAPRLILVSALTPTPAGEGKTTTSIGLAMGLCRLGEAAVVALREPSLGPSFGQKGGATGGGASVVHPGDRINLHFTGDFHAVTSAHNLLAALIDHHLQLRGDPPLDARRVRWPRVLDVNDRALRQVVTGLGRGNGLPREGGFEITAASEIMAILCLAEGEEDLRARLARTVIGFTGEGEPVTVEDLRATGALMALLGDALMPNLVQTGEGTPALVHGGPFANIAHGCSSVLATRLGLHRAAWVVTEAGFGFDLGAEKFFDLKCASAGLDTAAVVVVATVRALKWHGGVARDRLERPDPDAVARGLPNLDKHLETLRHFGEPAVVGLNRFAADQDDEIAVVARHCEALGVPFAVADPFGRGGEGSVDLAEAVVAAARTDVGAYRPIYDWREPVPTKIEKVARVAYGAGEVIWDLSARRDLRRVERLGLEGLPVCIAKTPASLSDDARRRNRPEGFPLTIRRIVENTGAGFLVVLTGEVVRMPGLPPTPRAWEIDRVGGRIVGMD